MRSSTRPMSLESLESRQMYAADLIGTAFDVTGGQPLPAGQVQCSFTLKNQNGFWFLDDAGAFNVQMYLSADDTIGEVGDLPIGNTTFTGLGAGQSVSRTIGLSVPATDPFLNDNNYRIGMVIDRAGQVAESNESNNGNQGLALDSERVWFEGHVQSPTNPYTPGGSSFTPGQSLSGAIGGTDERMAGSDIDTYWLYASQGQTIAFDLDSSGWSSNLRLYMSGGLLVAQDSGGAAPGEPSGLGESHIRYTFPHTTYYYLVVSGVGNQADPAVLTGRSNSSQGNYVVNTLLLPNAPSAPDLDIYSDSGLSANDNITHLWSLKFGFGGQAGKIAQLFVDGILGGTDQNGSIDGDYDVIVNGLSEGTHTVTANLLDPTTGYTSNLSSSLVMRIDRSAPTAPTPDLVSTTDTGVSNTDNITRWFTPAFMGDAEPGSMIQIFRNGGAIINGFANPAGAWLIQPTIAQQGVHNIAMQITDVAGNVSAMSQVLPITIDYTGPTLTAPLEYRYDWAPHQVTMSFSEDVAATITSADLPVTDLATSGTVGVTLAYDQPSKTATFSFSGALPKGNYRATLTPEGVTDVAGNEVVGELVHNFFFMPADANRDRKVDITDLGILASNWQGTNKTFTQGDFNYDGNVDITDLGLLASNWQGQLPPAAPFRAAAPRAAAHLIHALEQFPSEQA